VQTRSPSPESHGGASPARKMTVPLLDLKGQYETLRTEILPVLEKVCAGQNFILGPYVRELEQRVASYSQAAHGIGVSSGTDALLVALMALDVGHGDEVLTTPYTFFATGGTVARVGARPIYVDIDPATFNLSPREVQAYIDEHCELKGGKLINRRSGAHVKVLMPVHLYGQVADMKVLMEIARRYHLKVVEDAAQAIGSELADGRRAGSIGDIGCFSFFPSKNLGAFGDAGLCVANDPEVAEKLRILRVHGGKPKYFHGVIGGNFRIDELQAAVLCVKLGHLDSWTEARQRNALFYADAFARARLGEHVKVPPAVPGRHIYNQYVIRLARRDELKEYLADSGIGTEIYYPVPLHLQQCFAYLGYREGDCPESERAARETLALPIYPELREEQLQYVVDTIARFYA
jgi:dTDP-4-amino-4,6-dideoxygalactose transaminase